MNGKRLAAVVIILAVIAMVGTALAATYYHKPYDYSAHNYMIDGGFWMNIPYGAEVGIEANTYNPGEWFVYFKTGGRGGASLNATDMTRFSQTPPSAGELARAEEVKAYGGFKSSAVAPCLVPLGDGKGDSCAFALGAVVQYADEKGKGTGTRFDYINFMGSVDLVFTADTFEGKKFVGWKINDEDYQTDSASKILLLTGVDDSILVEAVFK